MEASQVIIMLRIGMLIEEVIRKALQEVKPQLEENITIIKDSIDRKPIIRLVKDLGMPRVEVISSPPSLIHQERISKKAPISN